jgi:hypothetical protein
MNSLPAKRLLAFFLVLFVFLAAIPHTALAQTKVYIWERFDVDVTVLENGDLQVVEQQQLNFSGAPFTFGFRNIPVNDAGRNDGIIDIAVRQGNQEFTQSGSGQPFTFTVDESSSEVTITWYFPEALGTQVYEISYIVRGAVRTEEAGDQVFWNAMPADLGSTILEGRVTMNVPEGVTIGATTALYGGSESTAISTEVGADSRQALFTLQEPRPGGIDVETGIRFPQGQLVVDTPDWQQQEQIRDVLTLIVLVVSGIIAVGGPALVLLAWYQFGRDPEVGEVPAYLSAPPDDTHPAVVGTLIDERAHIHDIMSTLVDLARRGYLTMEEDGKDFIFTRTDKTITKLHPFEQKTVKGVFGSKKQRRLNSLKYKFADRIPGIRKELYQELVERGYIERSPEATRGRFGCLSTLIIALAFGAFITSITIIENNFATALCPAMALGITGVALLWAGQHMPAKTRKGAEATAKWMAFKQYLEEIERYTDIQKSTEIFEQYLAYAIVFGLERSWIRKFAATPTTPIPPWYIPTMIYGFPGRHGAQRAGTGEGGSLPSLEGMSGGLSGGLESMSSSLTRMLTSTQTVLQSSQSSSSGGGGGFSGGFSGGSSGGGGGGFG